MSPIPSPWCRALALIGVVCAGQVAGAAAPGTPPGPATAAPAPATVLRDPMQPPPTPPPGRTAAGPAAGVAPDAAASAPAPLPPPRHLMTIDGRRYVIDEGRRLGVGDRLGNARIESIDEWAVVVKEGGVATRLPLFGLATRGSPPAASGPRPESQTTPRPRRPGDPP